VYACVCVCVCVCVYVCACVCVCVCVCVLCIYAHGSDQHRHRHIKTVSTRVSVAKQEITRRLDCLKLKISGNLIWQPRKLAHLEKCPETAHVNKRKHPFTCGTQAVKECKGPGVCNVYVTDCKGAQGRESVGAYVCAALCTGW
jgi:hypothetical protein